MEQQITIPKSIVSYFYNNLTNSETDFEVTDLQKCFSLLKQNYLVIDKDKILLNEILFEIESIDNEQKKIDFKKILGKLYLERMKLINHSLDNTQLKYFELCNASEDKIYFDPEIKEEDKLKIGLNLLNLGISELEIHTIESFLSPDAKCRFMNPDSKQVQPVLFYENTAYDLSKILNPFLREAEEIKFIDNYLANNLSIFHLSKILKILNKKCKVKFITLSIDDYIKNKKDIDKAKKDYLSMVDLAKEFNAKIENVISSGHLERYIITDKYEILLPGGFDQFNKEGIPYNISENKILKMVIEKIN